jgi:hypothetical protein
VLGWQLTSDLRPLLAGFCLLCSLRVLLLKTLPGSGKEAKLPNEPKPKIIHHPVNQQDMMIFRPSQMKNEPKQRERRAEGGSDVCHFEDAPF